MRKCKTSVLIFKRVLCKIYLKNMHDHYLCNGNENNKWEIKKANKRLR